MLRRLVDDLLFGGRGPELLASTVAINILALGSSLYSIHLLNRYATIGLAPTLITLTGGVLLAILFEIILRKQRQHVLDEMNRAGDEDASRRVYNAFANSRYEALGHIPLANRREALGAPMAMQQLGSTNNLGAILDLPFALMFIAAATFLYWPFGVFAILGCVAALLRGVLGERQQRASAEEHAKASSRASQLGQFLLTAGETIRCLPLRKPLSRRWQGLQADSLGTRRDGMTLQSDMQSSVQTIGQLLTVAVYCLGAIAVVGGTITTGALIGANILVSRAFAVCSRAAYLADPLLRASRANEALAKVEATELEPGSGASPAAFTGRMDLSDVAFSYPEQPVPLFEQLHAELPAGQILVLSGPNGSGKSTLIKLMLGLLSPKRGLIRADGIELRQLSQDWWRSHVGYASQEPVFFDGTLRENLLLDRDIDDAVLVDLLREMGLENFLASDPAGLDRMVSSHEAGMATGIRRRFVLIRAVLGDPKLVFLDDPTEGLDQQGQAAVAKLLNRLTLDGKTLVVASNEAFIQRAADLIIDMSKKPVPGVAKPVRNPPEAEAT
jgi:ATP-binding cassette subfamily C protein LapB